MLNQRGDHVITSYIKKQEIWRIIMNEETMNYFLRHFSNEGKDYSVYCDLLKNSVLSLNKPNQKIVMPISKNNNWSGLMIHSDDHCNVTAIFADSLNATTDTELTALKLSLLSIFNINDINIIDLSYAKTLHYDSSLLTIVNLNNLARNHVLFNTSNPSELDDIASFVGGCNDTDSSSEDLDWYTDVDINQLLNSLSNNGANYTLMAPLELSQDLGNNSIIDEIAQLLEFNNNITLAVPININGNHWVGLVLRNDNGERTAVFNNSFGTTIDECCGALRGILNTRFHIDDSNVQDLKINQQQNGYDCGPITVINIYANSNKAETYYWRSSRRGNTTKQRTVVCNKNITIRR